MMVAMEFPGWAHLMLKVPVPKRPSTTATTPGNWDRLKDWRREEGREVRGGKGTGLSD